MIRQIQYLDTNVVLRNIEDRRIVHPSDVKVKIAYSGVCGSDIHLLRGDLKDDPRVKALSPTGLDIGHEASGYILELGEAAHQKGLKVGDKVALYFNRYCGNCYYCRSGQEHFCTNIRMIDNFMSDCVVVDEQMVYKLDDDMEMHRAALAEPVSVCLHGIDLCGMRAGCSVAICGGGGIGNIMMQLSRLSGAAKTVVFEPVAAKRELALRCGADAALDPFDPGFYDQINELTLGRGFDFAIECSGTIPGIDSCCRSVGRGGTVELMATYRQDTTLACIRTAETFRKELRLIAGVYQSPYMLHRAIELTKKMDISFLTIFEPEQVEEAFRTQMDGSTVKAMFRFSG